jgi:membrane-associated protease RseP (regulator of RpoE activity)
MIVGLSVDNTLASTGFDGLLGAGFLSRYRAIFDYRHGQLILEPRANPNPDRFDRSGLFVIEDTTHPHRFTVDAVVPGSPAAAAGVGIGDEIVEIGGRQATALSLIDVRRVLTDPAVATVTLRLHRGGESLAVKWTPARLL